MGSLRWVLRQWGSRNVRNLWSVYRTPVKAVEKLKCKTINIKRIRLQWPGKMFLILTRRISHYCNFSIGFISWNHVDSHIIYDMPSHYFSHDTKDNGNETGRNFFLQHSQYFFFCHILSKWSCVSSVSHSHVVQALCTPLGNQAKQDNSLPLQWMSIQHDIDMLLIKLVFGLFHSNILLQNPP